MKRLILAATILIGCQELALAQTNAVQVSKVVDAEKNFNKLVERKGIKEAFLSVADPEGIVFKPEVVKITDFYNSIDKQPGTLMLEAQICPYFGQWRPGLYRWPICLSKWQRR